MAKTLVNSEMFFD